MNKTETPKLLQLLNSKVSGDRWERHVTASCKSWFCSSASISSWLGRSPGSCSSFSRLKGNQPAWWLQGENIKIISALIPNISGQIFIYTEARICISQCNFLLCQNKVKYMVAWIHGCYKTKIFWKPAAVCLTLISLLRTQNSVMTGFPRSLQFDSSIFQVWMSMEKENTKRMKKKNLFQTLLPTCSSKCVLPSLLDLSCPFFRVPFLPASFFLTY